MPTIAKNTHKAKDVFAKATRCTAYTLENYFRGQDCPVSAAEKDLQRFKFAKLTENSKGSYTVHVHGNCWYELS